MHQTEPTIRTADLDQRRREILARCEDIAPMPQTVAHVLSLLNDPDTDADAMESAMSADPVLGARLLSLANSALYGTNREISTMSQALVHVGFAGVRNLVLAASISPHLQHDYRAFGYDTHGLWQHSVAVAAGARHLAKTLNQSPKVREELFVAGLVHDLGKMVLVQCLGPHGKAVRKHPLTTPARERELLGVDHAEAGALVAAKWNLAVSLQELIVRHHDPVHAGDGELAVACSLLRLGHHLAHELKIGYQSDAAPEPDRLDRELEILDLPPAEWSKLEPIVIKVMVDAVTATTQGS